jgi:hypothetical protein
MANIKLSINAKQFDPAHFPWPEEIIPWEKEDFIPRDMIWGYVECDSGRVHVFDGDWIITILKNKDICKKDKFQDFKKSYEDKFKQHWEKIN